MQNIQDLKEKIFFESKNIIDILEKINNVDELLSKQDLVDELANRISFLRLLEKNIEYFIPENSVQNFETQQNISYASHDFESQESNNEVTEEEAIFNNKFNEIDENENELSYKDNRSNEIVEEDSDSQKEITNNNVTEEEAVFNNQLNEVEENEPSDEQESVLSFVDEERILANAEPETDDDIQEEIFCQGLTEEEVIFNNQLNEIDEFEDEENIQESINPEIKHPEQQLGKNDRKEGSEAVEVIPSIFDGEMFDEDEILIEENEEQFITPNITIEQGEMANETSNVENILNEIKHDAQIEEKHDEAMVVEDHDRRKIVDINKPFSEIGKDRHASDESFENLEAYNQEKKIKLSNIKGLKAVQSLFDDDPLEREIPQEKPEPVVAKEDTGSILKTNIPTNFMEAEKTKPEFRLDLNDRIAFSKMLFEGSQTDLNQCVADLNSFRNLEQAKEYLSDLYYDRKWNKVDEYAQRLWILVENKFL